MYLDKIVETKRIEVKELASKMSISDVERQIAEMPDTLGFYNALTRGRKRQMGLIAEVKKASPSKGLIRPDFHPVEIAKAYEEAGADCISVLTDETYFQGSGDYLRQIRVNVHLPLLRKDFIIDPLQIYEARILGADAVLLIAAILDDTQLQDLYKLATSLGLDALVEVHNKNELDRVLAIEGIKLIGINNRNLRTFETDLKVTTDLAAYIPPEVTFISESGIAGSADLDYLALCGTQGVLIGETFMRNPHVSAAVLELFGPATSAGAVHHG